EVAGVLRLAPHRVDADRGLFAMGLDSLMAIDVKTRLESLCARTLPSTVVFNFPTVDALAGYLDGLLHEGAPVAVAPAENGGVAHASNGARDELTEDEL